MKRCLPVLILGSLAFAQVAKEANERYQSKEGRQSVAAGLGRSNRDASQKPQELVETMELRPGMTVADIGTGVGYMLPFLSRAVGPKGRVIAEDIYDDFLEKAKQKVATERLDNVEFVKGSENDPSLPEKSIDVALCLDAYHHYDYPEQMLNGIHKGLRKGGRLVIVDFYKRPGAMPGDDKNRAVQHIRIDQDDVVKEVENHRFRLLAKREHIPGSQYMLVFEKK